MTALSEDLAESLEGGPRLKIYWPDDEDCPAEDKPGMVVLHWPEDDDWLGDGNEYAGE
jgi:hypothetical protein